MSSTGLIYRTPADVRAIPNEQWERWLETDTLPFLSFAATRECQMVLDWLIRATRRRMAATR